MSKNLIPASTNLPSVDEFSNYAGVGMEDVTAQDVLVPRLGILQAMSPQLKKTRSEYISGAEEGMIADLGTGQIFPEGVWFLPVHYRRDYLEWAPRDTGKGLVAIHSTPSILEKCHRDDRGRWVLPNGNYIAETAQFFGLNLSAGRRMCFIPMTSTQLKKARRWITLALGEKLRRADGTEFTAPLFYRTYKLTTAPESNNDGEWFGWVINRDVALPEVNDWHVIKAEALAFRESLHKGKMRGDVSEEAL